MVKIVLIILIVLCLMLIEAIFLTNYFIKKEVSNKEQVNHPAHYQKNGKECIDVMEDEFGPLAVYNFCLCNAFKYEWRAGCKDGNSREQDLAKADWYKNYAKKLFDKGISI